MASPRPPARRGLFFNRISMPTPKKVYLGLAIDDGARPKFWLSLIGLLAAAARPENAWCTFFFDRIVEGDSLVTRARNNVVAGFMASDCDELLFIDTDIVFTPEQIFRLVSHDESFVCGLYAKKKPELEWVANALPGAATDPVTGLQEISEGGTGLMKVHRRVFRALEEAHPELYYTCDTSKKTAFAYFLDGVFDTPAGRRFLSEDWYFCQEARKLGFPVLADTRVQVVHEGWAQYPLPQASAAKRLIEIPPGMEHCADVLGGEYDVPQYRPMSPPRIVDLGGNVGAFALWASKRWPGAEITSYEPHPENFEKLRYSSKSIPNHRIFNLGVRYSGGPGALRDGLHNCGEASFHELGEQNCRVHAVDCVSAGSLETGDILKIDTEGCEVEIVAGLASTSRLEDFIVIVIEYHRESDRAELTRLLSAFTLVDSKEYRVDRGLLKYIRTDVIPAPL